MGIFLQTCFLYIGGGKRNIANCRTVCKMSGSRDVDESNKFLQKPFCLNFWRKSKLLLKSGLKYWFDKLTKDPAMPYTLRRGAYLESVNTELGSSGFYVVLPGFTLCVGNSFYTRVCERWAIKKKFASFVRRESFPSLWKLLINSAIEKLDS